MSTLRVSNIEAKSDVSDSAVDEKIKITNSNQDVLVFVDGKTTGITTVGINTTNETFKVQGDSNITISGIVTATSFVSNSTTKAFYPPIVTTTQRDAMTVTEGAVVFNTTTNKLNFYTGSGWEAVTSS